MSPRKLSDEDREEILDLYRNSDETTSTLAVRFGVSSSTISRFLKNNLTELEYEDLIQQKRLARTNNTSTTIELDFFSQSSEQETSAQGIPTQRSLFELEELDDSLVTTVYSRSHSPLAQETWEETESKETEILELRESLLTETQNLRVILENGESFVTEPPKITVVLENQESLVDDPQDLTLLGEKQEFVVHEPQNVPVVLEKQESGLSEFPKIRETLEKKDDTVSQPQKITDSFELGITIKAPQYPLDSDQNVPDSVQDQEILVSSTTETQQLLLAMENDDLKPTESFSETPVSQSSQEITTQSPLDFEVEDVDDLPPVNVYAEMYGEDIEDEDEEEEDEEDWEDEVVSIKQPILPSQIQVLPLSEAQFPHHCYLVIDRSSELVTRPLSDFAALGKIPREEVQERTLPIFDNHRVAKRFCSRKDKVIKLPDGKILPKTSSFLKAKGITRMLIDGRIYSLS